MASHPNLPPNMSNDLDMKSSIDFIRVFLYYYQFLYEMLGKYIDSNTIISISTYEISLIDFFKEQIKDKI